MTAIWAGTPTNILALTPVDIDALDWSDIAGCPGVTAKELHRSNTMIDSLLRYAPGASTPGHPHPRAHHHIWIVDGRAHIGGLLLDAGSYVHVPPGTAHPITAGPTGCVLLHMHRRTTG
jgi:hypothetical protein